MKYISGFGISFDGKSYDETLFFTPMSLKKIDYSIKYGFWKSPEIEWKDKKLASPIRVAVEKGHHNIDKITDGIKRDWGQAFLLEWIGHKKSNTIMIDGQTISPIQSRGIVENSEWVKVGLNTWLMRDGGDTGREQKLLVYLYPPKITTEDDSEGEE